MNASEPRRQLMLRLPPSLAEWLHRHSVLEHRTKTEILVEAIGWAQALPTRERLRAVPTPSDDPSDERRVVSYRVPKSLHTWCRIEAYPEEWTTNELVTRVLLAWREHQEQNPQKPAQER